MTTKLVLNLLSLSVLFAFCSAQTTESTTSQGLTTTSSSHFTPDSPSSSFDSLGTGPSTTSHSTTIFAFTVPTFAPTITSCWLPPTGSVTTTQQLGATMSSFPAGAECWEIIRTTGIIVMEELFTVAANGVTVASGAPMPSASIDLDSSAASSSSIGTGSIVGAVIGSILGTLLIGATLVWIRKQRRSSKPAGTWLNRPGGWARNEKEPTNVMEMTRRDAV